MLFFFTSNMAAVTSRAHASIRSAEVKIGPFASDTSPKRIGREGLGKCRTGTRQGTPHYQLYPRPI